MKILIEHKAFIFLLLIVLIAAFLRFHQLSSNPPSLTWDEAAWGYNAYSIGIDGKDEFGRFLPHDYLESFGDYKPPVYAYLDVIPVKIFGLNEFGTRFPSALFGVLTVLMTFFLVKRIFNKSEQVDNLALLSSFILAISPWHIMLSRAAFEANVSTFFIVSGVWAFLAAVQSRKWLLVLSAILFVVPFYTFNTGRVVVPILVLVLALVYRKHLIKEKIATVVAVVAGIVCIAPTFLFLFSPQAGLRFKEVNIFSDSSVVKTSNQEIKNDGDAFWSKIIHNRRALYALSFVNHYFDNLGPDFLFVKGDGNPKFSTQNVGQLYVWDLIFLVGGVLFLFRKREGNWWIIPLWLLIGIIPAATARETPHALRIETTLPTFQIIVAYGFLSMISFIKKRKKEVAVVLFILLAFNFLYFFHDYLTNYKYDYSGEWQYGYVDSINYVKSVQSQYDKVEITQALGRPYIYYLFYTKTDPEFFRKNSVVKRDVFGFVTVDSFGKYYFPQDLTYKDKGKKVLFISTPDHLPTGSKTLKTFYLLNGEPVLVAYTF